MEIEAIILLILGAILYAIGSEIGKTIFQYVRKYGSRYKRKGEINLSGTWHAVWQTTSRGKEVLSKEILNIKQKGEKIIMENVERSSEHKPGGYLWRGEAKIFDNQHIVGSYQAREKNVVAKGTFYFLLGHLGDIMTGKWSGCNLDYDLSWGFGVISKEKDIALQEIHTLLKAQEMNVRGIGKRWTGEG